MQNEISAIANMPPETLALCQQIAQSAFWWGRAFIGLSIIGAILQIIVAFVVGLRRNDDKPKPESVTDPAALLNALKGVLEALASLPVWVAIYLAGLALFWVAMEAPKSCKPKDSDHSHSQAPAPPGASAANTSTANTTNGT